MSKVIVILVDGMRADAVKACGNLYAETFLNDSTYSLSARTVMPSVTLPCHMSLFHSVDPERHGILTNTYVPQVRPVNGLMEQLTAKQICTAFYYTWEELRDLYRPDNCSDSCCINQHHQSGTDRKITDAAIRHIAEAAPGFLFLYLGETDERGGHDTGWMSETYLQVVSEAWDCIRKVRENVPDDYDVIVLADHGGHGRSHGTDIPEDMTIPVILNGPDFEKGKIIEGVSIKDIAPTVAKLLGADRAREWEGKALC